MPLSAFSTLSMHAASLNGSLVLRLLQHKPCTMTTSKKNRNTASTDVLQAFIKLRAARGDDCEEDVVLVGDGRLLLPAARTKAGSRRRRRRQTDSQTHTHTHTHTHTRARARTADTHTHTPTHARTHAGTHTFVHTYRGRTPVLGRQKLVQRFYADSVKLAPQEPCLHHN